MCFAPEESVGISCGVNFVSSLCLLGMRLRVINIPLLEKHLAGEVLSLESLEWLGLHGRGKA